MIKGFIENFLLWADQPQNRSKYRLLIAVACFIYFSGIAAIYIPSMNELGWDLLNFLIPWVNHYAEYGFFEGLATDPSNYTPFYNYLLAFAAPLSHWLDGVYIIKIVSIAFIPIASYFVYSIILYYRSKTVAVLAALGLFAMPTVVLNAPFWGQADLIYTTFLLAAFHFVLARRPLLTVAMFGLSLSIKLQAMLFSPFLLYLILQKKIPWYYLALVPVVYILTILPEGLLGRPWAEMLLVYADQAGLYKELSYEAPNIYQFIKKWDLLSYETGVKVGLIVATIAGILLSTLPLRVKESGPFFYLQLVTLTLIVMPYVLPKMHERYFFPADIFSYLLFVVNPRYWPLALGVQVSSFVSYGGYLYDKQGATEGALIMTAVLGIYLVHMLGLLGKLRLQARKVFGIA